VAPVWASFLPSGGHGWRGVRRTSPLASPQNADETATDWPHDGRLPMLINLLHVELHKTLLAAQNSPHWARAKRLLLVMLGLWMSYFLLVNWFAHSLNKIAVPVIGVPLGVYLAVQGTAIVFAVALFRLARTAE
jgi:putative solute:sodium symporter small subunit